MTTSVRFADAAGNTLLMVRPAVPSADDPIMCPSHTLGKAAPRTATQPRVGRSGLLDLTAYHDQATWQGNLIISDGGGLTRHQWVDVLRAMLAPANRPYLYLQRDGWLDERRAPVRGVSLTNPLEAKSALRLEVSLQVDIPDGVLEAATVSSDTVRPGIISVGRTYPRIYTSAAGWQYTAGSTGAVAVITVAAGTYGATATPLLARIYGGFTDPVITNQTTGKVFALTGVTVVAGHYLDIDMGAKTVLLDGDPGLSYYNTINFTTSDWWELQPGDNQLAVGAATADATCSMDLFWYERWAI